jgi:hypothetical protein
VVARKIPRNLWKILKSPHFVAIAHEPLQPAFLLDEILKMPGVSELFGDI